MSTALDLGCRAQALLDRTRSLDFLAPLALRLYLAPIFWVSGMVKLNAFDNVVGWFGQGLGLPMPTLMAALATGAEIIGAVLLLLGLGVRWVSIPLMVTMVVAAVTVHWQNGWQAVASSNAAFASEYLGPLQLEDASGAEQRLEMARSILREHGNYDWLTGAGSFVVENAGVEFAATYFAMLLVLFFFGAGRYLSADYWLARRLCAPRS